MVFSRQLVSIVAATVLAGHVVVGCCAHHGHALAAGADVAIGTPSPDHEHGCRHACSHHSADPAQPSHDGRPCDHSCPKGSCSFLAGSKLMMPELAQPVGIVAAWSEMLARQVAPSAAANDYVGERFAASPLRSHLTKCVLLI